MVKRCSPVVVFLLSLCSGASALDLLGPPRATVGTQHWSLGIEYAYSETDTELSNIVDSGTRQPNNSGAYQGDRAYATVRYGVFGNLDVFARLGVSKFESQVLTSSVRFVGDIDLAWGLGAALTVYDAPPFAWGIVGQWNHGESDTDIFGLNVHWNAAMEIDSVQIATGPTYQVTEDLSVYGGGFYHALDGEYSMPTVDLDFEEDSCLGAFVGLRWEVKENAHWSVEVQHSGAAIALGTGLNWVLR